MENTRITFETAKLAKEKGFDIKGQNVFDLKNNNKIINFKDLAIQEFIDDVETDGYLDKAFNYLKEDINRTDDNSDKDYYLLAPTQSLLAKWLREKYNLYTESQMYIEEGLYKFKYVIKSDFEYDLIILKEKYNFSTYEEALEAGLQEALKLI